MPRCRSATLNACSRLCRALDLVRFWKSTSSGLGTEGVGQWSHTRGTSPGATVTPACPSARLCVTYLCLWMRALKASPSFQLEVKLVTFTWGYLQWGQGVTVTLQAPLGPSTAGCGSHHLPRCLHLAPEQQRVPGRARLPALLRLHDDVLDLGTKRTSRGWKSTSMEEGSRSGTSCGVLSRGVPPTQPAPPGSEG